MHNFKDPSGNVHCLSDADIENGGLDLLPAGCVEISQADADAIATPPLTQNEQIALTSATRDSFLALAQIRISPLQDAVDLDEATADEAARLTAWKQYRVKLNRIALQPNYPGNIAWPDSPEE